MRRSYPWLGGVCLVLVGYILGSVDLLSPARLLAQAGGDSKKAIDLGEETQTKIRLAADALKAAADSLINEQKYQPAIKGLNTFAILSGGRNAVDDLENGAIVDPETFAALYADLASDEVAVHLGRDDKDRLTYKNKVIRIYPVQFLQQMYSQRADLTGEELTPSPANAARSKTKPKDDDLDQ
ncbi:MAG: hypothetical protein EHM42_14010 [Planctomycetaceae bacterium]|nr:MAG: hypothetical protein EHM42_14010 [Planctomycetaceae bacterium]